MAYRLRRREFLMAGGRAALYFSVLPFLARVQELAPPDVLIADLEKQIPKLMGDAIVPGLSIAVIKDAKLFWRRGFGVKDSTSKQPVDNDTVFEAASTSKPVFTYAETIQDFTPLSSPRQKRNAALSS